MSEPKKPAAPPEPQGIRMPPTLAIITVILLAAALAAQFLQPGEFKRETRKIKKAGIELKAYEVRAGDTLESIAAAVGDPGVTTPEGILDAAANRPAKDPLAPGQKLLVPVIKRDERTMVVPGSYTPLEREDRGGIAGSALRVLSLTLIAPMKGFQDRAGVIAFILLLGGGFGILLSTGSVDAGLRAAVARLQRGGHGWVVIPALMILFSLAGATFGMSEETIPLVLITVPLALRMGYDSITGLCMSWLAAGLGFAGAFFNPFTVAIAQGIAEVPIYSGTPFRVLVWALVTVLGILYVMWWASRVKKHPELSPTFERDKTLIHKFEATDGRAHTLGTREILVLLIVLATVILSGWGATVHGWYINELGGLFLGAGILGGLLYRMSLEAMVKAFIRGASDLVMAALVVAFSAGILSVCQEERVLDTILNAISRALEGTHTVVGVWLMFIFQSVLNFFVPSGSGQAAMTMPIISPLSDVMGITRQTAVLAFQFGDGFGNMIIPTSAVTMSVLGIAEIPWERWAKWVLPLEILLFVFGFIMLAIAVAIGYS